MTFFLNKYFENNNETNQRGRKSWRFILHELVRTRNSHRCHQNTQLRVRLSCQPLMPMRDPALSFKSINRLSLITVHVFEHKDC